VDADHDRSLLEAAVAEHVNNEHFGSDIVAVTDRDDFLPGSSILATLDTQSPFAYAEAIRASGVAIYVVGGWLDAAFGRAQINYYNAVRTPGSTLTMGPWQHGGRFYSSPFVAGKQESKFDQVADLIRFFDYHLRGVDTAGLAEGPSVHYFTMGEERWKSAPSWPPPVSETRRYYFDAAHHLSRAPGATEALDTYQVDYNVSAGGNSRFVSSQTHVEYHDRRQADELLLTYTSEPLARAMEVTGHPIITLYVSSDRPDGLFLVYLEDVDAQGRVLSVTDGILRGRHRKVSSATPPYSRPGPYRTFTRADAMPIMRGEIMELTFDLFPVSYLFRQGHSVRIALSGADQEAFLPIPADTAPQPPPTWQVHRGGAHASFIDLPIVEATDDAVADATDRK
jgi:putative CocE/NonD family hydrolase